MAKKKKPVWELRGSSIHNQGMFARVDIKEGEKIIEYIGELVPKAESEKRCLEWDAKARKSGEGLVYIFDLNEEYDLDGNTDNNPAKYINHSCEENCEAINEEDRIFIYAKQDIKKDAELSFDYGYSIECFLDHPCRCGSEKCVGYIVAKCDRPKLKKILKKKKAKAAEKAKKKKQAAKKKKSAAKEVTKPAKKKDAKTKNTAKKAKADKQAKAAKKKKKKS